MNGRVHRAHYTAACKEDKFASCQGMGDHPHARHWKQVWWRMRDATLGHTPQLFCPPLGWVPLNAAQEHKLGKPWSFGLGCEKARAPILIQIAAFRDDICGETIHDAFHKAAHPERVHIAVVDQVLAGQDEECMAKYCRLAVGNSADGEASCPHATRIHFRRIDAAKSRGPAVARARQRDLVLEHYRLMLQTGNPDGGFCLQIDSHSRFARGWDQSILDQWLSVHNEFAILSTYIPHIDMVGRMGFHDTYEIPYLFNVTKGNLGLPRNQQASSAKNLHRPALSTLWAAGFSFSKCHAEIMVPNDPYLCNIFDGEEFSRGARLWTHGYDFYTPHRNTVYHDYNAAAKRRWTAKSEARTRKTNWTEYLPPLRNTAAERVDLAESFMTMEKAATRVKVLLGYADTGSATKPPTNPDYLRDADDYGLGTQRTLAQYLDFSGVDYFQKKSGDRGNFGSCRARTWVPHDGRSAYESYTSGIALEISLKPSLTPLAIK